MQENKQECCECRNGVYGCLCEEHKFCESHSGNSLREVENITFNLKGWEYPKCGLVNSPYQSFCPCSKIKHTVTISSKNSEPLNASISTIIWPLQENTNTPASDGENKEEGMSG